MILVLSSLLWPSILLAETPSDRGLAIATEADRRNDGFGDLTADMRMVLRNRQGQESERLIRLQVLEVPGDGDKSLTIFDTPRDVKGTAFLTYSHKAEDDDQWLYLPALKRVKRISSHNKSGSFMGSEFTYEDIASEELEKYTYLWLRDEDLDGRPCFVVERRPVDARNSGYVRQVLWIDQEEFRTWKTEFYDRKNTHLKTLTLGGYQRYLDRFWRAGIMHMVNHRSGKSTELDLSNYVFHVGLTERDFTQTSLKRVR